MASFQAFYIFQFNLYVCVYSCTYRIKCFNFFFYKTEFDGWIGDKIIPKMKNKNSLISFLNGLF